LDEDGETINSTDDEFVQPSDEDVQGNILTDYELARKRMTDVHRTPSKEDSKPAAQPENEDSSPSPEKHREILSKRDHELENIKKLIANLAENTQKHPKKSQRTRRETCNGNCGHEKSKFGHTKSFNHKNHPGTNNERPQINCSLQFNDQTLGYAVKLARLRAPPTNRSRKSNHNLEPRLN
jgi:hypothetical protein